MRKYWVSFKLHLQMFFEYRGDMVVFTVANSISSLVSMFLWLGVSNHNSSLAMSQPELISYFVFISLVSVLTVTWGSYSLQDWINNGGFSIFQLKPWSVLGEILAENLGEKVYQLAILTVLYVVLFIWLFREVDLLSGISLSSVILFIISCVMAMLVSIVADLMIGLGFIWFHNVDFIRRTESLGRNLLSGRFIPLIFLPAFFMDLALWLPFRYMVSFPVDVLLQRLTVNQLIFGFGVQIFWCLAILVSYQLLMQKALKSYQGYGV